MNKNKHDFWKKGLVLAIIGLFLGAGVVPSIGGDINADCNEDVRMETNRQESSDNGNDIGCLSNVNKINLDERLVDGNAEASSAESATDWWPMFHHDLEHSGYSTSIMPDTNSIKWSVQTGSWVQSSPAVLDNKVYIASCNGNVYCLDANTGDEIWCHQTGHQISSSPAVTNGKVYIGSYDHKVYCLDAYSGDEIWSYQTGNYISSSPAVTNGKIYIGSSDWKIYCLDAYSGDEIWTYNLGNPVHSSPAIADGKLFIGCGQRIYCLDSSDGTYIWDHFFSHLWTDSSPAVWDGKVYFCQTDNWIPHEDNIISCFNADSGHLIWSFQMGDQSGVLGAVSSPAVTDGKVYAGSSDKKIYCLDANSGDEIWNYQTGDIIDSSPAITDNRVYIGSDDGKVYCLDAYGGYEIWSYQTGDSVTSSPAVAEGKVYIGSYDHIFYCFGVLPPYKPNNPYPLNGDTNIFRDITISWVGGDPDPYDTVTYDIYFGNVSPPPKLVSNQSSISYDPEGLLDEDTTFFWQIVAWDNHGLSTSGDLWEFSTGDIINHRPNTPGRPTGDESGETGTWHTYKTSTTDPDGDDLYYLFDWDDGTDSGWIGPYGSGVIAHTSKMWSEEGTYDVRVKAKDIHNVESSWSETLNVTITQSVGNDPPNKPSTPSGETKGKAGTEYTYITSTTDPEGEQVYYLFDWGDGNNSDWLGPYESGATVNAKHIWSKGSYEIKVKAKDIHGDKSVWSDPLVISMPKSKPYFGPLFWFFERFTGRYPWIKHLINIQDKNYTFSHQFCGSSEYGLTVSTRGWKHANQEGTAVTVYGDIDALSLWINLKGFFCYDTVDRGTTWQAYAYQTPEVGVDFLSKNFDYTITGLIRTNKYYYIAVGKNIITNEIKGADNRNSFIPGFPEVGTSDADYGLTWMTPKGKLTHMGGASSCEVWFEYGTSEGNLNKESSHQTFTSVGEFSTTLDELTSCKTIYFTAVVSNDCGTTRGNTKNATPGKPNVATGSTSEQNTTSVYLNGNLNHLGGASSCEVWFEYGKFSDNLNKESSHQTFTSIGEFSIYITGLMRGETYYFRAVANNNVCRDYGNIESFTLTESYPPDMPTIVEGETFGVVNCYYRYVVTTTDPEHDRVQYYFDWGDGTGDWTDFCDSGDKGQDDHAWREPRVYEVRAKAKDEKGVESIWSRSLNVTIDEKPNNPPNKPSTPSGPTTGRAGVRYTYCTCATDPDGDQIAYYLWDWGDGENKRTTTWGPFDSGETVCENHTWSSRDRYEIIVWAVDVYGAISDSSDPLTVTLPKSMLGDKPKCCWSFQIFKNRFPWIGHISNIQNCSYILSHHFCSNSNSGDVEMKYYSP